MASVLFIPTGSFAIGTQTGIFTRVHFIESSLISLKNSFLMLID